MKTSSGIHFHPPTKVHTILSQILGASMWFFILYRMKQDGPVILGIKHPWEDHKSDEKH
ncbi:hypothetical protein PMAC_001558 [Pneumocystis sp. 'macacae']|nr:hypothetical protein PMAC_001558 [Pneumocystis sp. 'macacae']